MLRLLRASTALATAAALLNPIVLQAAAPGPAVTLATQSGTAGAAQARAARDHMSVQQKIALLRKKVKYVFVLFQENRSFDHYFGTYPGANGLFSTYPGAPASDIYAQPATKLPSYNSVLRDTDGSYKEIHPFLIPRTIKNAKGDTVQLYPEDTFSVDHSHNGYVYDLHSDLKTRSHPKNDGYPLDQQGLHYSTDESGMSAPMVTGTGVAPTANPNLQSKQKAQMVISHVDCDTVPFLWQYADRFVLFDNFHQTAVGPSTPNAIAMIAGQVGDTQWVKHPDQADAKSFGLPNLTDNPPFPGSSADTAKIKPPMGPDTAVKPLDTSGTFLPSKPTTQPNLTFASLPLSFMGHQAKTIVQADQHPEDDLADVKNDIATIAAKNQVVSWEWYQQGYGPEPFDGKDINENDANLQTHQGVFHYQAAPQHASYIVHHNGPQYFGYVGDNPDELKHMHSLQQFYDDVKAQKLPTNGGVFYVRGGYYNNDNLLPADPNPNVKAATPGNDDHPNYSDAQISEALIADSVNAIANSPYWKDSAIIISYDESDGLYDHQPERFRTWGPDGQPETGGPRIPTIVISPYAKAHAISHVYSEHGSVIKFLNELFSLVPLADLPDEAAARTLGAKTKTFNAPDGSPQTKLGPSDGGTMMGDLSEAFDEDRLTGKAAPLPASYATIDPAKITSLPHYAGNGTDACQALGITPTDYPHGYAVGAESDPPPRDFNPRPTQSPGDPYLDTNNNTGGASTGPWPN